MGYLLVVVSWRTPILNGSTRMPLDDLALERRGGHDVGAGEVHLARPAPAGEVAVDRAHGHLVAACRDAGSSRDAGAARGLDDLRAGLLEDLQVALRPAPLLHLLAPELDPERDALRDPLPLRE